MEKNMITMENIYNINEKGFIIGASMKSRRVLSRTAYERGIIANVREDTNREFITYIATICTDGTAPPPTLIYKGKSGDLQTI